MMSFLRRFGLFWYDFIVGDSVVLAIGAPLALLLAYVLTRAGANIAAEATLLLVILGTLAVSLRGQKA
jgi:hypothetical protein